MADFGLYNALRAKPDYDQRRKDAMASMSILAALNEKKTADLERRNKALTDIGTRFDEMAAGAKSLFDPDAERVLAAESKLRQPIIDEMGKWDNNPDMFLLMGGEAIMNKYVKDVINSDEMKTGLMNKEKILEAAKDKAMGKIWRPVDFGNVKGGSFDDQIAAYQNGDVSAISYNGAFDAPKVDLLEFAKIPNPANPYKGGQVDTDIFYNWLQMKHGMSPADAATWLQANKGDILDPNDPSKTVAMWGSRNPPKPDHFYENLAFRKWAHEHPAVKDNKWAGWVADTAYNLATNPDSMFTVFDSEKSKDASSAPFTMSAAFKGITVPQEIVVDNYGTKKTVHRKLDRLIRFKDEQDRNMVYPLYQDQISSTGKFLASDAKKNSPVRLDDLWSSLLVPAITNTYGTGAITKLQEIQDYSEAHGISGAIKAPSIPGAPASSPDVDPTAQPEDQYGKSYFTQPPKQ